MDFSLKLFPQRPMPLAPTFLTYVIAWQSEWSSDMIFSDTKSLSELMDSCLKYAIISGHAGCIYRFFGRPTNRQRQPHHAFQGNIQTNVWNTSEGVRLKHCMDRNSVKLYNEQNIILIETTINQSQRL